MSARRTEVARAIAKLDLPAGSSGCDARLRIARACSGLTMAQLGAHSGLAKATVAMLESGQQLPRIDVAERLANALDVSVCWLAYGEGKP